MTRPATGAAQCAMAAIIEERGRQDGKWSDEHDEGHAREEWAGIIDRYEVAAVNADTLDAYRDALTKLGAVALAALEACYRTDELPARLT